MPTTDERETVLSWEKYLDKLVEQMESDKNAVLVVLAFEITVLGVAVDKLLQLRTTFQPKEWHVLLGASALAAILLSALAFFYWFRMSHRERLRLTGGYVPGNDQLVTIAEICKDHTTERRIWRRHRYVHSAGLLLLGVAFVLLISLAVSIFVWPPAPVSVPVSEPKSRSSQVPLSDSAFAPRLAGVEASRG